MPVISRVVPVLAVVGVFLAVSLSSAAAEDKTKPTQIATTKNWTAYTRTTPDGKVCYALAKPSASDPKKFKRDPVYLLINDWPNRKVKDEIQRAKNGSKHKKRNQPGNDRQDDHQWIGRAGCLKRWQQ